MAFDEGTPQQRRVHRVSRLEGEVVLPIDLIEACGVLGDVWASRTRLELPEASVSIVSREGLLRMRRLAGRSQDLADVERLERGDG